MTLLGQITGKPKYYSNCSGNTYVGTIPPDPHGNPVHGSTNVTNICPNTTVLNKQFVACNSCDSYITLLTTIVHECRHGTQKLADNNECEAALYAAAFIRSYSQQICSALTAGGTCNNMQQCLNAIQSNAQNEDVLAAQEKQAGNC